MSLAGGTRSRAPPSLHSGVAITVPRTGAFLTGLATAVGPASRRVPRRRYADAPAAALLAGPRLADGLRLRSAHPSLLVFESCAGGNELGRWLIKRLPTVSLTKARTFLSRAAAIGANGMVSAISSNFVLISERYPSGSFAIVAMISNIVFSISCVDTLLAM